MNQTIKVDSTEQQIFEAAIAVFARHGRSGARMQDIADEAGITKALVHYYFRSKDRLYEQVARYVFRTYFESLAHTVRDTTTFSSALKVFLTNYTTILRNNPNLHRFVGREVMDGGTVLTHLLQSGSETEPNPASVLLGKIQAGMDSKELRTVDPAQTFITILGSCVFGFLGAPVLRGLFPAMDRDFDGFIEARVQHLYDVLYTGLKNPRRKG